VYPARLPRHPVGGKIESSCLLSAFIGVDRRLAIASGKPHQPPMNADKN
jgi:hypothetical protein